MSKCGGLARRGKKDSPDRRRSDAHPTGSRSHTCHCRLRLAPRRLPGGNRDGHPDRRCSAPTACPSSFSAGPVRQSPTKARAFERKTESATGAARPAGVADAVLTTAQNLTGRAPRQWPHLPAERTVTDCMPPQDKPMELPEPNGVHDPAGRVGGSPRGQMG